MAGKRAYRFHANTRNGASMRNGKSTAELAFSDDEGEDSCDDEEEEPEPEPAPKPKKKTVRRRKKKTDA